MGRGHRAQSPVHTTVLPSKHKRKEWSPPLAWQPPSFSVIPLACGAGRSLLTLTCPAHALFHALLPSAAVWARVSLLSSTAARQRVSPLPPPPPPGDLRAATQDRAAQITQAARRFGCALRAHEPGRAETQSRAGERPALRRRTRAHTPPGPEPAAGKRHPRYQRHPKTESPA